MVRHKRLKKLRRFSPRKRYRSFRKGKSPISILTAAPILFKGAYEPIFGDQSTGRFGAKKYLDDGHIDEAIMEAGNILCMNFTGFQMKGADAGKFNYTFPLNTYTAILAGVIGSKLATKFGVNRQMAKVPFIGKYAKL